MKEEITGITIKNYGEIVANDGDPSIYAKYRDVYNYGKINADKDNDKQGTAIILESEGTLFMEENPEDTEEQTKKVTPEIIGKLIFKPTASGKTKAEFKQGKFNGDIEGQGDVLNEEEASINSGSITIHKLENAGDVASILLETSKEIKNSGTINSTFVTSPKITNSEDIEFYDMTVDELDSSAGNLIASTIHPGSVNETKFFLYGYTQTKIDFQENNVDFETNRIQNVEIKVTPGKEVTFVDEFKKGANLEGENGHQISFYLDPDAGEPNAITKFTMKNIEFATASTEKPGGVDIIGSKIEATLDGFDGAGGYSIAGDGDIRGIYIEGKEQSKFINEADINVTTIDGEAFGVWASGIEEDPKPMSVTVTNNKNIKVENNSDTYNAYGIKLRHGASATNASEGKINVKNASTSKFVGDGYTGNAYGIYSLKTVATNLLNYGEITVEAGEESSKVANAYGIYAEGYIDEEGNPTDGGEATITNTGKITIKGKDNDDGDATSAGIFVKGAAQIQNGTKIDDNVIIDAETAYGIYVDDYTQGGNSEIENYGVINTTGKKTGIYAKGAKVKNHNKITSKYNGVEITNGMFTNSENGTITVDSKIYTDVAGVRFVSDNGYSYGFENSGTIEVNGPSSGRIFGVYFDAPNGFGTNTGTIKVSGSIAIGVYIVNGTFSNSGTISISHKNAEYSYGMYGANGETPINAGEISGVDEEHQVYPSDTTPIAFSLRRGARLVNYGLIEQEGVMDLDSMGDGSGEVIAGKDGTIKADEVSGNLVAGSDITTGSNEDEYINENSVIADKIEVDLTSGSAMFGSALLKQNNSGSILMTRKSFNEIMDDKDLAQYLEQNYQNNNRIDLFDELKGANDNNKLYATANTLLGRDFLPLIALQNQQRVRHFNNTMEDLVLDNDTIEDERSVGSFIRYHNEQEATNTLPEYEDQVTGVSILFDKAINPNYRFGTGIGLYNAYTDFDSNQTRRDNILQLYLTNRFDYDGWGALVMPFAGYGHGEYKNVYLNKKYEPDFNTWYLGLNNRIFLKNKFGNLELNPTAELNINNIYQDTIKENKHITLKGKNSLSAETGIGVYAKHTTDFGENGKLDIRAGAMYYRELNHNTFDDTTAKMFGMDGTYDVLAYQNDRNRTELSIKAEYKINKWTAFAEAKHNFQDNDNSTVNIGIKLAW